MGTLAIAVAYTIRACLSVAIVEMVVPVNNTAQAGKELEFRVVSGHKNIFLFLLL